jgi:hypothetical protein
MKKNEKNKSDILYVLNLINLGPFNKAIGPTFIKESRVCKIRIFKLTMDEVF